MSIVDATLPDDNSLISDLPSFIRETRAALNIAGVITKSDVEVSALEPSPTVAGGLDVIMLTAPYAQDVMTINSGVEGDIVLFFCETAYVTFIHGTGNINLKGDPANADLPTQEGDVLILIFRGTAWEELHRVLV